MGFSTFEPDKYHCLDEMVVLLLVSYGAFGASTKILSIDLNLFICRYIKNSAGVELKYMNIKPLGLFSDKTLGIFIILFVG